EPLYKYPECRLTKKGREYIGKVNKTESGKECLRWDTQPYGTPDDFLKNVTYSKHFSNIDTWSHHNYCRNPSGKERPWCFVKDDEVQWEHSYPECKKTEKGKEYSGKMNKTETGKDCLRWDQKPYRNPNDFSPLILYEEHFLNEDVEASENYCRNPALRERPWCFISDPNVIWEFCDIP
ncbi:unnamed protein product, partial [Darwinula stevensoni]